MQVLFKTRDFIFAAEFNNSKTAQEIISRLPLASNVSIWGNEIYFDIGFKASAEAATMEVCIGDVAYWPQGKCLCIFFGPTPASTTNIPVPASPVVIVGKIKTAIKDLKAVQLGDSIFVELSEESRK